MGDRDHEDWVVDLINGVGGGVGGAIGAGFGGETGGALGAEIGGNFFYDGVNWGSSLITDSANWLVGADVFPLWDIGRKPPKEGNDALTPLPTADDLLNGIETEDTAGGGAQNANLGSWNDSATTTCPKDPIGGSIIPHIPDTGGLPIPSGTGSVVTGSCGVCNSIPLPTSTPVSSGCASGCAHIHSRPHMHSRVRSSMTGCPSRRLFGSIKQRRMFDRTPPYFIILPVLDTRSRSCYDDCH